MKRYTGKCPGIAKLGRETSGGMSVGGMSYNLPYIVLVTVAVAADAGDDDNDTMIVVFQITAIHSSWLIRPPETVVPRGLVFTADKGVARASVCPFRTGS